MSEAQDKLYSASRCSRFCDPILLSMHKCNGAVRLQVIAWQVYMLGVHLEAWMYCLLQFGINSRALHS